MDERVSVCTIVKKVEGLLLVTNHNQRYLTIKMQKDEHFKHMTISYEVCCMFHSLYILRTWLAEEMNNIITPKKCKIKSGSGRLNTSI